MGGRYYLGIMQSITDTSAVVFDAENGWAPVGKGRRKLLDISRQPG